MKLPTKLNVIAGVAAVCSFIFLFSSWPMQWFGTGPIRTVLWFAGLALVPVSGITFLVSIGVGIKRGLRMHACVLGASALLLVACATGWLALFKWFCNFE